MLKLFKNSFHVANDCLILATPLIIFLSVLSWYYNYLILSADALPKLILGGVTLFVMSSAFLSAWLYMSKKVIALSNKIFVFDRDRPKALLDIVLSSPKGIGKLCLPIMFVLFILLVVFVLLYFLFLKFKYIAIVFGTIFAYIVLVWLVEIVYVQKNPIKAFKYSVWNLIRDYKKSIVLFLYIVFLGGILFLLNMSFIYKPILYFFVLLLFYYFLVYLTVLLFMYYEQKIKQD
jgi:hypothetical protein